MAELAATKRLQGYVGAPTESAVYFVDHLLIAAEDHFGAICRLVEHAAPVLYADKVLARAGIAACARATWMLDPSVDADHRAARGLTQRLAGLKANAELVKESVEARKSYQARREEVIAQCRAAGLTVTRRDSAAYVGEGIPSERSLMKKLFGTATSGLADFGAFSQTWLSRFVHSDPAGLAESIMDSLPPGVQAPHVAGTVMKGLAADSGRVNTLMAMCTAAYVTAAGIFLRHQGWLDDDWTKTVTNVRGLVRTTIGFSSSQ